MLIICLQCLLDVPHLIPAMLWYRALSVEVMRLDGGSDVGSNNAAGVRMTCKQGRQEYGNNVLFVREAQYLSLPTIFVPTYVDASCCAGRLAPSSSGSCTAATCAP